MCLCHRETIAETRLSLTATGQYLDDVLRKRPFAFDESQASIRTLGFLRVRVRHLDLCLILDTKGEKCWESE